jgi:mRNA-degrading endonuclease RelE of RelBE toxin-antitoxin system
VPRGPAPIGAECRINSGDRIIFRIEKGTVFFVDVVHHDDISRGPDERGARVAPHHREPWHLRRQAPEAGVVIPGTGGCRKLRWADRRRGKGKRGGLRVIYYYLDRDMQIWLLTLYDKDKAVDLSAQEKRLLKAAIEQETRLRSRLRDRKGH